MHHAWTWRHVGSTETNDREEIKGIGRGKQYELASYRDMATCMNQTHRLGQSNAKHVRDGHPKRELMSGGNGAA